MLNELRVQYNLEDQIRKAQQECPEIWEIRELMELGKCPEFREDEQGVYWYKDRIYVPSNVALREEILDEGHDSRYCRACCASRHLQLDQGRTPKTSRTVEALRCSNVEVGKHLHGVYSVFTSNPERESLDLGNY